MALAKKCDRCGNYYDVQYTNQFDWPTIRYRDRKTTSFTTDDERYDLCPDCEAKFEEWMKNTRNVEWSEDKTYPDEKCRLINIVNTAIVDATEIDKIHHEGLAVTRYVAYGKEYGRIEADIRVPDKRVKSAKEETNESDVSATAEVLQEKE